MVRRHGDQYGLGDGKTLDEIAGVKGTADYLIPASEEAALAAATAGTAITYSTSTTPAQHDKLDEVYDFDELEAFLASLLPTSTWRSQIITV